MLVSLVVLLLGFISIVVKDVAHPLSGGADYDYWEYTGFYLRKNLRFLPFPQLNLTNDQSFYPYGVNGVFQPWGIERDYFYGICSYLFGTAAWVQIYYLISIAVAFLGSFALLQRDYGFTRAWAAGLMVTAGSFYTIAKYPGHTGYAIVHWTILSFIADFLLVKKITLRSPISLQLLLVRVLILLLSLGQELGYVAALAITSFTVSGLFILVLAAMRWAKKQITIETVQHQISVWKQQIRQQPRRYVGLIALILAVTYLYVPLVVQISVAAKSFQSLPSGSMAASPLRLLIPFFPGIDPSNLFWDKLLKDGPEGVGAGSPGYFLLILGMLGLWQARGQRLIFAPLLLIFWACIFYEPTKFATLKILPWFAFARIGGRVTIVYPVILTLFALHFESPIKSQKSRRIAIVLAAIACLELSTFYQWRLKNYQPYAFDPNFNNYMATVKAQPGEAVLDFPFCAIGGNAVGGAEGLCPYYTQTCGNFSFRRFHGKKVMGQYFGRVHPDQLKDLIAAGWPKLLLPDSPSIFEAVRQKRCFNAKEWQFFEDFYRLNDFAGINLYVDRFPPNCVEEFYQRFGQPVQSTVLPLAGKVVFIPKPESQRRLVDSERGLKLKLE
jgi:hypothetical protein